METAAAAQALTRAGHFFHSRGWAPATAGNYSARLDASRLLITRSGAHKGELTPDDLMVVGAQGQPENPALRPSAETRLHTQIYAWDETIGSVLHVHSVHSTLLSHRASQPLVLEDYELLKAFAGVQTHATRLTVPVFANSQDMEDIAAAVAGWRAQGEPFYGYLIAGHGLYTWGCGVEDARRHVEAFEFLFECEIKARAA
jgi:methylthioribulose-1-phosphate dehydratase